MPTIELPKGMSSGMNSARRAIPGMPPGMLALSTRLGEGDESGGYRNPSYPDHEDIGERPTSRHRADLPHYRELEEEPTMAEIARMGLSNRRVMQRSGLPPGMLTGT